MVPTYQLEKPEEGLRFEIKSLARFLPDGIPFHLSTEIPFSQFELNYSETRTVVKPNVLSSTDIDNGNYRASGKLSQLEKIHRNRRKIAEPGNGLVAVGSSLMLAPVVPDSNDLFHSCFLSGSPLIFGRPLGVTDDIQSDGILGDPSYRIPTYISSDVDFSAKCVVPVEIDSVLFRINRDKLLNKRNIFADPETFLPVVDEQRGLSYFVLGGIPADCIEGVRYFKTEE